MYFAFTFCSATRKLLLVHVHHARGLLHITTYFCPFSDFFSALIIASPLFLLSENKTCMVFSCISIGTYSMFSPYVYESFTKYPSHLLPVMLPGNSLSFLSTILVPYYTSQLISTLSLTYFRSYYCFSLVYPF